jgi:hypothetical protein
MIYTHLERTLKMIIPTATEFRKRALMLLKIERIQFNEQMVLLGYQKEKAAPVKRGKLIKRPSPSDLSDTIQPNGILPL